MYGQSHDRAMVVKLAADPSVDRTYRHMHGPLCLQSCICAYLNLGCLSRCACSDRFMPAMLCSIILTLSREVER